MDKSAYCFQIVMFNEFVCNEPRTLYCPSAHRGFSCVFINFLQLLVFGLYLLLSAFLSPYTSILVCACVSFILVALTSPEPG